MAKKYGFTEEELKPIRNRDEKCVYCDKPMVKPSTGTDRRNWATVEHLNEKRPFYKEEGLKIEGLVICCFSCNSSRGKKSLKEWFEGSYCTEKHKINPSTVADVVKKYIKSIQKK